MQDKDSSVLIEFFRFVFIKKYEIVHLVRSESDRIPKTKSYNEEQGKLLNPYWEMHLFLAFILCGFR